MDLLEVRLRSAEDDVRSEYCGTTTMNIMKYKQNDYFVLKKDAKYDMFIDNSFM